MGSFNPNHDALVDTGRRRRSGPTEEDQTSLPGVSSGDVQGLDLNHVTEQVLREAVDDLDGALVHALICHRVHHGHFTNWDDVAQVPGIDGQALASLHRVARIGTS
jgi:DNA uptake protein ComE-like DNA-binding protein